MEIIQNNSNGYLTDNLLDANVNSFVKNLLYKNEIFEEISFSCIEKSKKYDWLKTANALEILYKNLIR